MRLSDGTIKLIVKGFEEFSDCPKQYELYVFGSRVDPHKRGGDIDILLIVEPAQVDAMKIIRHRLVGSLKKYIDDQKLDLTIMGKDNLSSDPFYQAIKDSLILIRQR